VPAPQTLVRSINAYCGQSMSLKIVLAKVSNFIPSAGHTQHSLAQTNIYIVIVPIVGQMIKNIDF